MCKSVVCDLVYLKPTKSGYELHGCSCDKQIQLLPMGVFCVPLEILICPKNLIYVTLNTPENLSQSWNYTSKHKVKLFSVASAIVHSLQYCIEFECVPLRVDSCYHGLPGHAVGRDQCLNKWLTLNVRGPSYLGLTRSISWLLMPWLLKLSGHQQPWYWLYRICRSFSYLRKDC